MDRQEGNGSEKQEQQGGTHQSHHVEDKEENSLWLLHWNWEAGGRFPRYVWNNQKIIDRDRAVKTNHPRWYLNNFQQYVRIIRPLKNMDNIHLIFLSIWFINMVDVHCAVIHKKVAFFIASLKDLNPRLPSSRFIILSLASVFVQHLLHIQIMPRIRGTDSAYYCLLILLVWSSHLW